MIFRLPAITSDQPKDDMLSRYPARTGPAAAARLRGTSVMLAAAARSDGGTTAMTYELRVGTSIWDRKLRASSKAIAQPNVGMNGMRINSMLAGRCVNTMVFTNPNRLAMRVAARYERAENMPAQKKIVPAITMDSWNFWKSHNASIDCTTKPPPNASRLNSAASV